MRRGMLEIVGGGTVSGDHRRRLHRHPAARARRGDAEHAPRRHHRHALVIREDGSETNEAIALVLRLAASDDQGPFFGMEFIQLTRRPKLIANLLYRDASVFEEFRQRRR